MAIENKAKDALTFALDSICEDERKEENGFNEKVKNLLAYSLDPEDVCVFDAMVGNFSKAGETQKRGGERPREGGKQEGHKEGGNTPLSRYMKRALQKVQIEQESKRNRINPEAREDRRQYKDLQLKLKEAKLSIEPPDNPKDTESITEEIENLCKEANIKDYTEFPRYEQYLNQRKEYSKLVETAAKEAALAESKLNRFEFNGIEDDIERIKRRGQQIEEYYADVLDTLQSLYEDICRTIESREKGLKVGGLRETEKAQYGLLPGEDGEMYQTRMKKSGRGKEIPETIKRIDEMVEDAERRWQRVAALSPMEFEVVKANWRKTVINLLKHTSIASNMFAIDLNTVLEDHYRSRHELGVDRRKKNEPSIWKIIGASDNSPLQRYTANVFGTKRTLPKGEYEKYGCLHTRVPTKDDNLLGGQYGRNVIRWKSGAVVATLFCGDSLYLGRDELNYCTCSLVSDPSPASFNPENLNTIEELKKTPLNLGLKSLCRQFEIPYIEIQIHGANRPTAEDIESISFYSEEDIRVLSPEAIMAIQELRIVIYVKDTKYSITEEGQLEEEVDDSVEGKKSTALTTDQSK